MHLRLRNVRFAPARQRGHTLTLSLDEHLELVCEDLRRIEKDPAFEVVEAYGERRMHDFASALQALKDLADLRKDCAKGGQNDFIG